MQLNLTPKETTDERLISVTKPTRPVYYCGCDVLPWEDCSHTTEAEAEVEDMDYIAHLKSIWL